MNDLRGMCQVADEDGESSAEIDEGVHVYELRAAVEDMGYIFKTDGRVFSVIKNRHQPIKYAKTGAV